VDEQGLICSERDIGKGRKPRAIDVFNRASTVHGPAGGWTLEDAVLAMKRSKGRRIPAYERLQATRKDVLHILACHRNPLSRESLSSSEAQERRKRVSPSRTAHP